MKKEVELKRCWQLADALIISMDTCLRSENPANVWKYGGYKQFARKYNTLLDYIATIVELPPILDRYNLDNIPGPGDTLAYHQKDIFESVHANASLLRSYLRSISDVDSDESRSLQDFFQAKLRSAILEQPSREKEVQDALERILIGRGLLKGQDYDRETGRVKVSAKEVVPDFIFPRLGMALEVKLTGDAARMRSIIDEINADIRAYKKNYKRLLFVVYDIGSIRDESEFRRDLEAEEDVSVLIIKH